MTELEEKVLAIQKACAICGLKMDSATAELVYEIVRVAEQKGLDMSVRDATNIRTKIDSKYPEDASK